MTEATSSVIDNTPVKDRLQDADQIKKSLHEFSSKLQEGADPPENLDLILETIGDSFRDALLGELFTLGDLAQTILDRTGSSESLTDSYNLHNKLTYAYAYTINKLNEAGYKFDPKTLNFANIKQKITHDSARPLQGAIGYYQLTFHTSRGQDEEEENLNTASKYAQHLLFTKNFYLDLLTDRNLKKQFNLRDLAELASFAATGSQSYSEISGENVTLFGNPNAVYLALYNESRNGYKYGDGKLHLHTHETPEFGIAHVIDNGGGVPPVILPHIFEDGFSGKGSTGLGLHVAKHAIEDMNGGLLLVSRGQIEPYTGAAFMNCIPKQP